MSHYCWQPAEDPKTHYRLSSHDINVSNAALELPKAERKKQMISTSTPPLKVRSSLKAYKASAAAVSKDTIKNKLDRLEAKAEAPAQTPAQQLIPYYQPSPAPAPSPSLKEKFEEWELLRKFFSQPIAAEAPPKPSKEVRFLSPPDPAEGRSNQKDQKDQGQGLPPSSPVRVKEGEDQGLLRQSFFRWFAEKNSSKAAAIRKAYTAAASEG